MSEDAVALSIHVKELEAEVFPPASHSTFLCASEEVLLCLLLCLAA